MVENATDAPRAGISDEFPTVSFVRHVEPPFQASALILQQRFDPMQAMGYSPDVY